MNKNDELNYKTLRRIQQEETNSPLLTRIDPLFYKKFSEYITYLEKIAENEKNEQKIKLYNNEIQNIKKIGLTIYEIREKKIVQAALSTVRGAKIDMKNITEKENTLFISLVEHITKSRKQILEEKEEKTEKKQHLSTQENINKNRHDIVRVIQDTPTFIGTDMKPYCLHKNDVLTLPDEMKNPLLKKEIVSLIKQINE
ncbi:MAG: hypothetical protein R6V50_06605 [Thermoplasmatota archaeon]